MQIKQMSLLGFYISYIDFSNDDIFINDPWPEIKEWLKKNIQNSYYIDGSYISFSSKYDALAFKLKWF